jgi:hypothetical protein
MKTTAAARRLGYFTAIFAGEEIAQEELRQDA